MESVSVMMRQPQMYVSNLGDYGMIFPQRDQSSFFKFYLPPLSFVILSLLVLLLTGSLIVL